MQLFQDVGVPVHGRIIRVAEPVHGVQKERRVGRDECGPCPFLGLSIRRGKQTGKCGWQRANRVKRPPSALSKRVPGRTGAVAGDGGARECLRVGVQC